jgi:hypothetical protein
MQEDGGRQRLRRFEGGRWRKTVADNDCGGSREEDKREEDGGREIVGRPNKDVWRLVRSTQGGGQEDPENTV